MEVVWPGHEHLDSYIDALRRGWVPGVLHTATPEEEVRRILADPQGFLAEQVDRQAKGSLLRLLRRRALHLQREARRLASCAATGRHGTRLESTAGAAG